METVTLQMPDGSIRTVTISAASLQSVDDPLIKDQVQAKAAERGARALADETGPTETALVTAGETFSRLAEGAARMAAPPVLADVNDELASLQAGQVDESNPVDALREQQPGAALAGDVAALAATGGPARLLPQVAMAGLQGAALAESDGDDRIDGAVTGAGLGLLGVLGGKILTRVISPQGTANPTSRRTRALARKLGLKLTAGQRSGSKTARNAESQLRSNPASSAPFDELDALNQKQLNKKALESIGEKGDEITDQVIESARLRVGTEFDEFGKSIPNVDPDSPAFMSSIADIEQDAIATLDEQQLKLVRRQLNNVLDTFGRPVSGEAAVALRSQLDKITSTLMKTNGGAGELVSRLTAAVEDLIFDNAPSKTRKQFATMRRQWQNLRFLRQNNVIIDEGLQPGRLRAVIQSQSSNQFRLGKQDDNPLFQIARLQEGVRELVGNSGTATREAKGLTERVLGRTVDRASAAVRANPVGSRVLANQIAGPGSVPAGISLNVGRATGVATGERDLNILDLEALLRQGGIPVVD